MLKIGVLGVGHLGKIHLKCIGMLPETYELVGFYDPDDEHAKTVVESMGYQRFDRLEDLLEKVDVVDIVAPTFAHFDLAVKALEYGCHVFIEKPVTHTLKQAEELLRIVENGTQLVQVGHVERFNPALLSLGDMSLSPMFIEAHRLSMFNPRGTDVSVVLDLMIHDLDILLNLVDGEITRVSASGVSVVSATPDICNAHLEFSNGCVANLTASRISLKQMRKIRLFQKDAYVSLDFLDKQAQVVRMYDKADPAIPEIGHTMDLPTPEGDRVIHINMPEIQPINAIKMELETFAASINAGTVPKVPLKDGYEALKVAHWIMEEMEKRNELYTQKLSEK